MRIDRYETRMTEDCSVKLVVEPEGTLVLYRDMADALKEMSAQRDAYRQMWQEAMRERSPDGGLGTGRHGCYESDVG